MDLIASIIIAIIIIKTAIEIFIEGINKMLDKSCNKETTIKKYRYKKLLSPVEEYKP